MKRSGSVLNPDSFILKSINYETTKNNNINVTKQNAASTLEFKTSTRNSKFLSDLKPPMPTTNTHTDIYTSKV